MKAQDYDQIVEAFNCYAGADATQHLIDSFPQFEPAVLSSIVAQEVQKYVKSNYKKFVNSHKSASYFKKYTKAVERGEGPGILLNMATKSFFPPALLAKIVLERWLLSRDELDVAAGDAVLPPRNQASPPASSVLQASPGIPSPPSGSAEVASSESVAKEENGCSQQDSLSNFSSSPVNIPDTSAKLDSRRHSLNNLSSPGIDLSAVFTKPEKGEYLFDGTDKICNIDITVPSSNCESIHTDNNLSVNESLTLSPSNEVMSTPDVQLMLGHTSDTAEKQAGPSIGSVGPSVAEELHETQFANDLTVPLSRNSSLAKDSREAQANDSVMKTTTRACAASGKSGAGLPLSEKKKNASSKSLINKMLRDTSLIPDKTLSFEVHLCLVNDDVYGPFADTIKHSIGHEYEELLKRKLRERGVGYQTEEELRALGCDKTPDTRLDVPIGVGGRVVNWIESKASFGDRENHRSYLNDQLWSYWNRFGPGLVIYWFGYIDELNYLEDKGILVRDCFPDDIVTMDPLAVKTSGLKHL